MLPPLLPLFSVLPLPRAGGTAALLTMLLQQSGLPPQLGPMRCITMGTGEAQAQA